MSKIDRASGKVQAYIKNAHAFGQSVQSIQTGLKSDLDYEVSVPTLRSYVNGLDAIEGAESLDLSIYEGKDQFQVLLGIRKRLVLIIDQKTESFATGETGFPKSEIAALKVINDTLEKWKTHSMQD